MLIVMQVSSALAYVAIYFFLAKGLRVTSRDWMIFGILAVVVLANYAAFTKALQIGPISIVSSIVAAYAAVVVVLAVVVLGETLNVGQVAGATVAIVGVTLAATDLRTLKTTRLGKGVVLAFASLVGFGITSFIGGVYAQKYSWLVPALAVRLFSFPMIVVLAGITRKWPWQTASARTIMWASIVGVIEASGYLAFTRGSELGFVAIVAAASATYPTIPLILGLTVFKERLAPNQWIGVISVLAGVVLLGLSGA
jgi:drug/metabolite transporter (DMT)-like permease